MSPTSRVGETLAKKPTRNTVQSYQTTLFNNGPHPYCCRNHNPVAAQDDIVSVHSQYNIDEPRRTKNTKMTSYSSQAAENRSTTEYPCEQTRSVYSIDAKVRHCHQRERMVRPSNSPLGQPADELTCRSSCWSFSDNLIATETHSQEYS